MARQFVTRRPVSMESRHRCSRHRPIRPILSFHVQSRRLQMDRGTRTREFRVNLHRDFQGILSSLLPLCPSSRHLQFQFENVLAASRENSRDLSARKSRSNFCPIARDFDRGNSVESTRKKGKDTQLKSRWESFNVVWSSNEMQTSRSRGLLFLNIWKRSREGPDIVREDEKTRDTPKLLFA